MSPHGVGDYRYLSFSLHTTGWEVWSSPAVDLALALNTGSYAMKWQR
jgi:hypothetical protein